MNSSQAKKDTQPAKNAADQGDQTTNLNTNQRLKKLLKDSNAKHRVLAHEKAGLSEEVAKIRGSSLQQGAKALLLKVKIPTREPRYVLAVVGSDKRVNPRKVASFMGGKSARLADRELTERMTGCEIGAIPPISFTDEYQVVVDRGLLEQNEIVFNAGLLTESVFLDTSDYLEITKPAVTILTD